MTARMTRRRLLGIAAVGTVAAATGASLKLRGCRTPTRRVGASDSAIANYVDSDGWILTPADSRALGRAERDGGR